MNIKLCIPTFQERFFAVHNAAKAYFTDHEGLVLDLGCGEGENAFELAKHYQVTAIDINADDIKYCRFFKTRNKIESVNFSCQDATHTSLPNAHVDYAICVDVLEHVPQPGAIIAELARVLKPGGRAIITIPSVHYPWTYDPINAFLRTIHVPRIMHFGAHGYGHDHLPDPEQIAALLQKNGFEILQTRKLTSYLAGFCELYWASLLQKLMKRNATNRALNTGDGPLTRNTFLIRTYIHSLLKPFFRTLRGIVHLINLADQHVCRNTRHSVGMQFIAEKKGRAS